ncbi:hypothetical protein H5T88_05220 [bacterium]|nr:hypothetical protein [bacterium]
MAEVDVQRRCLLGALMGFCGVIYSFIIGWFLAHSVKDRHPYISMYNLMAIASIAVIFGIGGLIGG